MKKKILVVVLGLTLCFGMIGCSPTESKSYAGSKSYNEYSKLVSIEGENDLYYYATTHIVYIVFNECAGNCGYGYMSPYYSKKGKLCTYNINSKQIEEVEE